ncbi:hypothetical protein NF212_04245 [Parasalinivibrio latis]|uniref:hypothetical protein n=1 Tax=Parasalinivibrio latis TaxID=2952610 RepID=UPI0030E27796
MKRKTSLNVGSQRRDNLRARAQASSTRRKRLRSNMHKKVLWRHRLFSTQEFAEGPVPFLVSER